MNRRDFLTRSALALLGITAPAQPASGEPIIDIHQHLGYRRHMPSALAGLAKMKHSGKRTRYDGYSHRRALMIAGHGVDIVEVPRILRCLWIAGAS